MKRPAAGRALSFALELLGVLLIGVALWTISWAMSAALFGAYLIVISIVLDRPQRKE